MAKIEETLKERNSKYGEWRTQANIAQNIKGAMRNSPNWNSLTGMVSETLEMIAHKISRILNGDSHHVDSWHDIVGYAKLVEERLLKEEQEDHAGSINSAREHFPPRPDGAQVPPPPHTSTGEVGFLFLSDRNLLMDAQSYCLDYVKSNKGNRRNAQAAAQRLGELIGRIDAGRSS